MTALIARRSSLSVIGAAFFTAMVGTGLVVLSGHVQADALHAAAHDVRHATGFPCH